MATLIVISSVGTIRVRENVTTAKVRAARLMSGFLELHEIQRQLDKPDEAINVNPKYVVTCKHMTEDDLRSQRAKEEVERKRAEEARAQAEQIRADREAAKEKRVQPIMVPPSNRYHK